MLESSRSAGAQVFPPPKKKGCWFYGCLTASVLLVVVVGGLYFGTTYAIKRVVQAYTSTTPLPIPEVVADPVLYQEVSERLNGFVDAVRSGTGPKEIRLKAREINQLIANHPDFAELRGHLFVELASNTLEGTVSAPLGGLGYEGRYLSGKARFRVAMTNGVFEVYVETASLDNKTLDGAVLQGLKTQNLASELYKNPKATEILKKLETVSIADGEVVVVRR